MFELGTKLSRIDSPQHVSTQPRGIDGGYSEVASSGVAGSYFVPPAGNKGGAADPFVARVTQSTHRR